MLRRRLPYLCGLLGFWTPDLSRANPPQDPDFGVTQIIQPLSSTGRASSLVLNPALLSDTGRWELELQGVRSFDDTQLHSGFAAYASFGLLKRLHLAYGLARNFAGAALESSGVGGYQFPRTQLSLGLSVGNPKKQSLGAALHWQLEDGERRRPVEADFGYLARIGNYVSIATALRYRPVHPDIDDGVLRSELGWRNELSVRPFGHRFVELAGGIHLLHQRAVQLDDKDSQWLWSGRASTQLGGVGVDLELRQAANDPMGTSSDRGSGIRLGIALRLSSLLSELSIGARSTENNFDALAVGLRVGDRIGPSTRWIQSQREILKLDLSTISSDATLLETLEDLRLERSHRPRTLLLVGSLNGIGWAAAQELRIALCRYIASGGRIFAYLESASRGTYYVASVAEAIWMHPSAHLTLYSPGSTSLYFKDVLDRLSIRAERLHSGPYKSAFESTTRSEPSPADQEQRLRIYSILDAESRRQIAVARPNIAYSGSKRNASAKTDSALERANSLDPLFQKSPISPREARDFGLIDDIRYEDEIEEQLEDILGHNFLHIRSFAQGLRPQLESDHWATTPYIGVVMVEGMIVRGESVQIPLLGINLSGHETFKASLKKLADDPSCKGVIIRVNSPGGDAIASEKMWRQVERWRVNEAARGRHARPLVVSMSDSAASGGYYLSAAAEHIVALPTTVTGSIGVTSLHFDLSGFIGRIGIDAHYLGIGDAAAPDSMFRPWTETQRDAMHRHNESTYQLFVERVSAGRKIPTERVRELAGGRVWMGHDAISRYLIDELGGYEEAREWLLSRLAHRHRSLGLRIVRNDPGLLALAFQKFRGAMTQSDTVSANEAQVLSDAQWLQHTLRTLAREPLLHRVLSAAALPQNEALLWSDVAAEMIDAPRATIDSARSGGSAATRFR